MGTEADDRFARSYRFVREAEGGYVNHPADPGGATKWGVTQRTYSAYHKQRGHPPRDVRNLREDEAWSIYRTEYWERAGCERLAWPVCLVHFDAAVHHGPHQAATFLSAASAAPDVTRAYLKARRNFFLRLVARRPSQIVFLKGWITRLRHLKKAARALAYPEEAST